MPAPSIAPTVPAPRGAAATRDVVRVDAEPPGFRCVEEDGFDAAGLSEGWISLRRPVTADWLDVSARPGWARLRGGQSLQSLFAQSLVARRLVDTQCTVRTAVEFMPRDFTHMAGLVCYYDTQGYLYLRLSHDDDQSRVLGVVANEGGVTSEYADTALPVETWPVVHLRADIDRAVLRFSYSPDGIDWLAIGPELDMSTLSDDFGDRLRFTGGVAWHLRSGLDVRQHNC